MASLLKVARCDEVPEERGLVVSVRGRYVAVFRVGDSFFAMDNSCQHAGASLGDGDLIGACIHCPWHGWRYDVTTGVCLTDPRRRLPTYPVKIEGDEVFLEI